MRLRTALKYLGWAILVGVLLALVTSPLFVPDDFDRSDWTVPDRR